MAHEMYVLPRYADVRTALADAETFCSGKGVGLSPLFNEKAAGRNLLMTDGALHLKLRKLFAQDLTPRRLRRVQEQVDEQALRVADDVVRKRDIDAVADLARALPLTIVPDLIGWPEDGREHLLTWAGATFDLLGPMNARAQCAAPQAQEMFAFAAQTAEEGRMLPDSVGAAVVEAARRGEIEPDRASALLVGYLAPSLDTTISALGAAFWLFSQHPDQWQALRADPSLVPNAFNEVVRLSSPIRTFSRVTTRDVIIDGISVPEGARLMLHYAAANRDETQFPDPDAFDVRRPNAGEHLGFGFGPHGCAGQGLARMEAHALLEALISRVERWELHEATPNLNNIISGWASLAMTLHPAEGAAMQLVGTDTAAEGER
ncbi:MAG: cytochrome P450 [Frankiaceae bacterium]|nr:cytochrome P450 [Frankiaceae bacterium]